MKRIHRTAVGLLLLITGAISAQAQPAFRIQTIAGSNNAGDGGAATQAILRQSEGVAVDPAGVIYVADAADHRIRAISPDGTIRTIAGDGSPGVSGDGGPAVKARLNSPYGLGLDRQGNLYVADLGNARIRVISPEGTIRTVAGGGDIFAADSSEGTMATSLKLKSPRNVLADPNGGFYFSDFDAHRVYYVDFRGILTIAAGTGNPGYGADNLPPTRSALRNPAGLAFEPQGGLIIVESGAQRLRRVARGVITAYLSDAFRNYPFYSPTGIAFDNAGNLYLADARATGALKRTPQGVVTELAVSGRAVAADPAGGAIYASNNVLYRVDAANKITRAAGAMPGAGELTGDGGIAENARLLAPAALAYDADGNLFVADERGHRIRRVTPAGMITTIAGTGAAAYSGDGGQAIKAGLNAPRGLAFDANGFLYVADSGNHAIRRISPSGAIVSVAGNGFSGFRGDGGPASAAMLNTPSAVAVDPNGDVFLADTANHRIRRIGPNGLITTSAGSGTAGLAYDGSAAVFAQLNEPRGIAFDTAGNLYIADTGNNRIRRVDLTGLLTTVGEPSFNAPRGVYVTPGGTVYVADTGNNRICRLDGETVTPVAGSGTPGFSGDGGPALDAELQSPAALAADAEGNLAIADMGNARVRQLRPEVLLVSPIESAIRFFNAASAAEGPLAPGMLATLIGDAFGPTGAASAQGGGAWPNHLGEVNVFIGGEAAPLLYTSAKQINLQVPVSVAGKQEVTVEVFHRGVSRAKGTVRVVEAAPGLFPQIVHENSSINSANNPVARGAIVLLYATGIGFLPPESIEIRIGTMAAQVLWAGPAPGLAGLTQINLRLPSGFFPAGSLPVTFRIGTAAAPQGVFVYLQ